MTTKPLHDDGEKTAVKGRREFRELTEGEVTAHLRAIAPPGARPLTKAERLHYADAHGLTREAVAILALIPGGALGFGFDVETKRVTVENPATPGAPSLFTLPDSTNEGGER